MSGSQDNGHSWERIRNLWLFLKGKGWGHTLEMALATVTYLRVKTRAGRLNHKRADSSQVIKI